MKDNDAFRLFTRDQVELALVILAMFAIVFAPYAKAGDWTLTAASRSISAGYETESGYFAEVSKPRFGTTNDSEIFWTGGTGVTTLYIRHDSVQSSALALTAGKSFKVTPSLKILTYAGIHRYERVTNHFSRLEQFDETTGAEIIDRVTIDDRTKKGIAGAYGVGVAMPMMRHLDLVVRYTKYLGLGEHVGEVGLQARF